MEKHRHVVVIYPHPDDESFGAAGHIVRFREAGVPVTYLCGTLGEMGRNMGTPPFANRETLWKFREQELADACEFLDIDFRFLGFRDKTIEFEKREHVTEVVKAHLEELQPSLVITHYPEHGVHPDHNALCIATIEAVGQMEESIRPTLWASAITDKFEQVLGEPDIELELTKEEFDRKLQAIFKHKSQAEGLLEEMGKSEDEMSDRVRRMRRRLGKERYFTWKFTD